MDSIERSDVPPPGDPETLALLRAALAYAPRGAVFSGKTAAWLHGLSVDPCNPIEMIVPIEPDPTRRPNPGFGSKSGPRRRFNAGFP